MPDPALDGIPVKKDAHGNKDQQRDQDVRSKRRNKDTANIDFLNHGFR
jgi:hypothetical protein